MKSLGWLTAFLMMVLSAPVAIGQAGTAPPMFDKYEPRLADIMSATQSRHIKLWLAGEAKNWDLAAYELRQLKAGLVEAASLYPGIPVSSLTTMSDPIQAIARSIEEKSAGKFRSSFAGLTSGCTACHQSVGLGFLVMQAPSASPFGNQVFKPR
jgi:hypothetical protein